MEIYAEGDPNEPNEPLDDPVVQRTWASVDDGDDKGRVFVRKLLGALDSERGDTDDIACSFCGAHRRLVDRIISGPNVYICDRCAFVAAGLLKRILPPPPDDAV